MQKRSLLILFLFLAYLASNSQTIVYGKVSVPENDILNELIQISILDSNITLLSGVDGRFHIPLLKGDYTLRFAGHYSFFSQDFHIPKIAGDSIEINVLLERVTKEKITQRIPKGVFPKSLLGKWHLTAIQSTRYGHIPTVLVGMNIHFALIENRIPMMSYSDRCRGLRYQNYVYHTPEGTLDLYYTYRPLSHTCELRPCDERFTKEKVIASNVFRSIGSQTKASYNLSPNAQSLVIDIKGSQLYLRRVTD